MERAKKYTVITGASSGIGRETAKAFANRGKSLIIAARRTENLEALKCEILEQHPTLDVVIRTVDLSVLENVYQFYSSLKDFRLETWINNAGFGNDDSVAQQDLGKIDAMLRLNVEALTILPTHYYLDAGNGLTQPSLVLLEQIRTVDKRRLSGYIGRLDEKHIRGINHALAVSIGLIEPVPPKLTLCLCNVIKLVRKDARQRARGHKKEQKELGEGKIDSKSRRRGLRQKKECEKGISVRRRSRRKCGCP